MILGRWGKDTQAPTGFETARENVGRDIVIMSDVERDMVDRWLDVRCVFMVSRESLLKCLKLSRRRVWRGSIEWFKDANGISLVNFDTEVMKSH